MATVAQTIRISNASNALIKAWGSAISAALAAVGLVQTADTGQINWSTTTVTATGGSQTFGYEIWRFNDSLQATKPVFFKMIYGTTNNGLTYCRFAVYLGTGTDGAGNLTGLQSNCRSDLANLSSPPTGFNNPNYGQPCFFFGDGSSIAIALGPLNNVNPNSNPSVAFWFAERTRNADNTINGDGVIFGFHYSYRPDGIYYTAYNYISFINNAVVGSNLYWPMAYPSNDYGSPSVEGSSVVAYPFLVAMPKPEAQACTVLGNQGGINNFQTVSLIVNGASHTYLSLPGVIGSMPGTNTENNSGARNWCALLMRYE